MVNVGDELVTSSDHEQSAGTEKKPIYSFIHTEDPSKAQHKYGLSTVLNRILDQQDTQGTR